TASPPILHTASEHRTAHAIDQIAVTAAGGAALAGAVAALAVYVGLIGSGHWYGDEFYILAFYRDKGLAALADHIVAWSPRPVSEPLLFAYAQLVAVMGRPLIRGMLGSLWLVFLLGPLVTVRWRQPGVLWRVAAGLSLLAMMIAS